MYFIIEEKAMRDGMEYTTYGIGYGDEIIHDVYPEREALERLIEECNTGGVEPVHIYDIVSDFLYER